MTDSDEELTQVSPLSRRVRWIAWSVVAALALLAAVVAIRTSHATRHPKPAPTGASQVVALPKVGTSTAPGATSPPRTAAAAAAGTWWEVKGTTLDVENANGRYNNYARVIPLPSAFATSAGRAKLTVDPVTGWVWVVLEGSRPSFMLRVSARFARVMREIRWPMPVHDVAACAGRLYLSTDRGSPLWRRTVRNRVCCPGLPASWDPWPSIRRVIA